MPHAVPGTHTPLLAHVEKSGMCPPKEAGRSLALWSRDLGLSYEDLDGALDGRASSGRWSMPAKRFAQFASGSMSSTRSHITNSRGRPRRMSR